MSEPKKGRGRPPKYVKDDKGREVTGLRLHVASGRYYDIGASGKRVYFGTAFGAALMRHRRWKHVQRSEESLPPTPPPSPNSPAAVEWTPSSRHKERLRQAQRAEILAAAASLFLEKDPHEVSMREIARLTGIGTGTLYNYFDNKDTLQRELTRVTADRVMSQQMAPLTGPGDEVTRLKEFIANYHRTMLELGPSIQLYYRNPRNLNLGPSNPDAEITRIRLLMQQAITSTIQAGINKRLFRSMDAQVIAVSLLAMLEAIAVQGILFNTPPPTPETVHQLQDFFVAGIVRR